MCAHRTFFNPFPISLFFLSAASSRYPWALALACHSGYCALRRLSCGPCRQLYLLPHAQTNQTPFTILADPWLGLHPLCPNPNRFPYLPTQLRPCFFFSQQHVETATGSTESAGELLRFGKSDSAATERRFTAWNLVDCFLFLHGFRLPSPPSQDRRTATTSHHRRRGSRSGSSFSYLKQTAIYSPLKPRVWCLSGI